MIRSAPPLPRSTPKSHTVSKLWNTFHRAKWWKLAATAILVLGSIAFVQASASAQCPPVLEVPRPIHARPSSAVAWSSRRSAFVVADDGEIREEYGDSRASRRLARLASPAVSIATSRTTDLVAIVTPSSSRPVTIYSPSRAGLRALGGGVEPWRSPSRVSLGDVDGDGRIEALVLVTGRARFDRRLALRPFIYGWDGRRLFPKWLGSRLSRPFDDATLGDLDRDGRDELVAVEHTRDGAFELAVYRWRGFGFERVATSAALARVCGPSVDSSGRLLARVDGGDAAFELVDSHIVRL